MSSYRVFDQCGRGNEIALCDGQGRFHIASIASIASIVSDVPSVGTDLNGVLPTLGLGALMACTRGQMYRVTFEVVDCTLESAFNRLHPQLTVSHTTKAGPRTLRG